MSNNFRDKNIVLSSAINMFMRFSEVENAEYLFELSRKKNEIVYGSMMKGYNLNNEPLKCLKLFEQMKQQNIIPNEIIFNLFIGACSQISILSICQSIVDQIPSHLYNKHIYSSLIDMWASISC
jgi:pentatricopeptide repeat protein